MRLGALILVAVGFWAAVASAEESQTEIERHDLRSLVAKYAQCVVHEHHDEAKTVLMSNSNYRDINRHHSVLIDSGCITPVGDYAGVGFHGDMFRYALADALVRADFQQKGPESFADRLPLAQWPLPTQADLDRALVGVKSTRKKELEQVFDYDQRIAAFSIFGECVARTDPVGTRLWILTEPDVPEEVSRIKALMPAFQKCLKAGAIIKFRTEQLRGAVALDYYRLANATPQPELGAAH